jgi:ABC-2 type transport system permease protein
MNGKPLSLMSQIETLAWLEVRQMIGGAKLIAIAVMLGGLAALAMAARVISEGSPVPAQGLFLFMMNFVFLQTMVLLIPLLFATSLIQNEVDSGTLVYLVTRPIPRPMLLLSKFAAVTAVSGALVLAGMAAFLIAFLLPGGDPTGGEFSWWGHLADFAQAGLLGVLAYGALFTLAGLIFKRGLIWGLAYGFISEFVLTNIPALVRKVTIMHYLRSVALADVDITRFASGVRKKDLEEVSEVVGLLDLATPGSALITVAVIAAICLTLSSLVVWNREFASQPSRSED